ARDQERGPVGRRLGDRFGGDVAAGAGPVLDHDRLGQGLGELRLEHAREGVVHAPRRKGGDQLDRLVRPGLALGRPRARRRGGGRWGGMLRRGGGRLWMTMGWARASVSFGWSTRARVSCTPPGAKEMISLIGLSGQVWPCDSPGPAAAMSAAQARMSLMVLPP